jgi:hypothetical protein|tara:strand:- start:150 stop:392 length:243 start_codon:yes stop_codon:yes gene_type:complete
MYYTKKKRPALKTGDILFCWDDEVGRNITGYILSIVENKKLNDYDVNIRWNDPFVAMQKASYVEALQFIRMGLWKHRTIS